LVDLPTKKERAQIDDSTEVKVAKRRPKNERKQSLKAKEESSDDGTTASIGSSLEIS